MNLTSTVLLDAAVQQGRISPGRLLQPAAYNGRRWGSDAGDGAGGIDGCTFRPRITARAAQRRAPTIEQLVDGGRGRREKELEAMR